MGIEGGRRSKSRTDERTNETYERETGPKTNTGNWGLSEKQNSSRGRPISPVKHLSTKAGKPAESTEPTRRSVPHALGSPPSKDKSLLLVRRMFATVLYMQHVHIPKYSTYRSSLVPSTFHTIKSKVP